MTSEDIVKTAMEWSNGEPEMCADIAVYIYRLYETAYAKGLADGIAAYKEKNK